MVGKINTEEAHQLHAQGMSDCDLARHFNVTQSGATRWRQRQGLPANNTAGTVRVTADSKRKARKMFREGATVEQVARAIACSENTARKIRGQIKGDPRLRGHGVTLQGARNTARNDVAMILADMKSATRHVADATIREDAMGDMFLAIMEGRLERDRIKTEARRYTSRAIDQWQSKWAPASIDEALTEDGFRLVDLIPCPRAAAWLKWAGA